MLLNQPPLHVAGQVWMLGSPAYPIYLLRGQNEGAIVEGGISALGPVLTAQLDQMAISADYVRQAVVTHAHPDHVMAVPLLRARFPQVSVIASATAAATLGAEKAVAFFRQIDGLLTQELHKAGLIAATVPPPEMENRIAIDRVVRDGDTISVDGTAWQVLETPGHSDCSISLHDATNGVLIISDATGYYMPEANAWWPNYFSGYDAYVRSIERLAALEAHAVCLSHNGAVVGREEVRGYFAGALAATRGYHNQIVAEVGAGKPPRQVAEELGAAAHRQAPVLPLDFFQKNCSILIKQSMKSAGVSA